MSAAMTGCSSSKPSHDDITIRTKHMKLRRLFDDGVAALRSANLLTRAPDVSMVAYDMHAAVILQSVSSSGLSLSQSRRSAVPSRRGCLQCPFS